jgi:diguanylate cyclase (GGDEF)-like protein
MQLPVALNIILGSALIVVLIFADYVRKFNTDRFQKYIFCSVLIFTFIPMAGDFVYFLIEGKPGSTVYLILYGTGMVYYFFQVLSYYYTIIFVDYMLFKDFARIKKISIIVYVITLFHVILLAANLKWHFYFYIEPDTNLFFRGKAYILRMIISYSPLVFVIIEFFVSRCRFKKSSVFILFLLLVFSCAGSSIDLLLGSLRFIWPCMSAVLLYSYFFIIQTDTRLDGLTGIGNRYSFNEFTDRLSKCSSGESWAIVMIDMDHFKEINDTLGHQEGDNALRDMAAIIKGCLKGSDFAARYGGDEFVIATRVENGIGALINELQEAVGRHNEKKSRPFKIEISYGYDVFVADGSGSIDDFLNHIDSLMYKHKEERRRSSDKREVI